MTIVFSDAFTVGSDTDPASYPAGTPDYSYAAGSAGSATIEASTDRFRVLATGADIHVRLIKVVCPTGDQQITGDCRYLSGSGQGQGGIGVRCAAASWDDYVGVLLPLQANEVTIYRIDAGTFTEVAAVDRGIADVAATFANRMKATGTNPVDVEFQIGGNAPVTFSDSSASRKQVGRSLIWGYINVGEDGWVDNITVDDLLVGDDMTWVTGDRVKETSTTVGTGNFTLAGALSALWRAFSAMAANLDTFFYVIEHQSANEWEVGYGQWNTGGTLTRLVVLQGSSGVGVLVNFSSGTKHVWADFPGDHGLLHPQSRIQTVNRVIPPDTSVVVVDSYTVNAGCELLLSAGAVMEVA